MEHWTMRDGANDLHLRVVNHGDDDIECICQRGKRYVEGEWPIHGWTVAAGQCCECMNIRVYMNGTEPTDWNAADRTRREYVQEHSDSIHICDLDAFIEMLQAVRSARETGKVAAMREP
jgi:hypothetical protein